jgi:RimJ/RimL family protein N-acetyltransferase
MAHEELRTERLSLRRPTPADVDAIFAVHREPAAVADNPSDALATRGEAETLYRRWDAHWRRHAFGYWVLRRRDAWPQVGFCGVKVMEFRHRPVLNLFYRLAPAEWGSGLASEAATAVVEWAAESGPGYPLIARVRPDNVASARVASNAGLVRAAELDEPGFDGLDQIYHVE